MKLLMWAFRKETAAPLLAVIFASGVCAALVLARIAWGGHPREQGFLLWNLFLAWLPLVFAIMACEEFFTKNSSSWRFRGFAALWLLFFPNAPYIFTDLIHLTSRFSGHF